PPPQTNQGVNHRFLPSHRQVVAILFRGRTSDFITFHQSEVHDLAPILHRPEFQRSIEAGVLPSGGGFAVLEYVEGQTLKSWLASPRRPSDLEPLTVLRLLFELIWIPL
ncbi:MAG TPA: hypothetical protein DDZ51_02525, partial [Planctomycetaceae bacterium]|nr:hypothetical protein [Planctomycetaceae bacterium]